MNTKEIEHHNKERLQAITDFLKEYRISNGYSQQEISEYSGIHRNTIVRYESSNPENLTLLTIFNIADALELDINQIFLEIK